VTDSTSIFIQKAAEVNERLLSITEMPKQNKHIAKVKDWDSTPEREAMSILELMIFLFTIIVGFIMLMRRNSAAGGTVLDYILTGNWTHGPNLFSFTAVYFLACALFLVLAVLKVLAAVFNAVLSKRVLTIASLLLNIIFYAALLAFIFLSLSFLGVNTKALIASAGFVGLAVILSLQDILSDVFAGIMIITGRTFEVGDYIEIKDGEAGTVAMIGLRRTELIGNNGKTFSIRNSQIIKVINHSRAGVQSEAGHKSADEKTYDHKKKE
jgi:small conductance mechanosensitive channel